MKDVNCPPGCYPTEKKLKSEIQQVSKNLAEKRLRINRISEEMYQMEAKLAKFDRGYIENKPPSKVLFWGFMAISIGALWYVFKK